MELLHLAAEPLCLMPQYCHIFCAEPIVCGFRGGEVLLQQWCAPGGLTADDDVTQDFFRFLIEFLKR